MGLNPEQHANKANFYYSLLRGSRPLFPFYGTGRVKPWRHRLTSRLSPSLQVVRALLLRIFILRRALNDIEQFLATTDIPIGTEVSLLPARNDRLLILSSGGRGLA